MKGTKTSLFLVELMISLLLFAFCAAICLQIFNAAGEQTRKSEALSKGVFRATEVAELYKAFGGDITAMREVYSQAAPIGGDLVEYYDAEWQPCIAPVLDAQRPAKAMYSIILTDSGEGYATIALYDLKKVDALTMGVPAMGVPAVEPFFSIDVKAVA